MLWNPAAIAAAQAATVSRFGVFNINGWCLLIIITASLMVNYCFGLLCLSGCVIAFPSLKICVDAGSACDTRFKSQGSADASLSCCCERAEQITEPITGLHATKGHEVQTVLDDRLTSECFQ